MTPFLIINASKGFILLEVKDAHPKYLTCMLP